jgi:L-ascorbate metabolism protein UlaG (beta-lactamase superfamily)
MVKITWHGHACVSITRSDGYTIVFDPHDGISIGLRRPNVKGDLILVTHDHFDHNAIDVVKKENSRIFKEFVGETEIDNIVIKGYRTYHDKFQGKRRGLNTVYVIEVEGNRIAHLGDLGHIPREEVINAIKNIDLLIIPVGGTYTIGPDEAWDIIVKTEPQNVLPVHYWIPGLNLPLYPIDDFLVYVKKYHVVRLDTNSFMLDEYNKSIIIPRYK